MTQSYDVIVIGLGAMGSAAAFHLARRGVRVLGLDAFDVPHDRGSSHGESRMIRLAYYEHPDYVPLLRRAYELWDELSALAGEALLHRTGGVYMGPPTGQVVPGALRAARQHGLPHESLSRADLAERYPLFTVPDDYVGVFEPEAGFLRPERCIAAHAERARRHGATLLGCEAVLGWRDYGTGVSVRTRSGEYDARRLIVCAGAWTSKLLADLRVPLVVTRQPMGWVRPPDPAPFVLGRFPVWGIERPDDGALAYGFPVLPGSPGLKLARHAPGPRVIDPDRLRRDPSPADDAEIQSLVRRHLPSAAGPTGDLHICMYTNSPDGHFVLDRHPVHPCVLLAAGFSGHGFKFASVMGEALADLASDNHTELPVGFLSLARFGG